MTNLFSRSALLLCLLLPASLYAGTLTVTNNNDAGSGSLRQAVLDADDGDEITFSINLSGQTITLLSDINIDGIYDINGLGADQLTLSGNNSSRILTITSGAIVNISGLSFVDGSDSFAGGAISVSGSTTQLSIDQCQFLNNNAASRGGAIHNDGASVNIFNTTISANISDTFGGGINNEGGGQLFIRNSTLSGNMAMNSDGGAITNFNGTLDIASSTVINNFAAVIAGGIGNNPVSTISNVSNTIIANNNSGSGNGIEFGGGGVIISNGGNLVGRAQGPGNNNTNSLAVFTQPNDQTGTVDKPLNPQLGGIADNGGPTLTHLPMNNSSVIDSGLNVGLENTDQRGLERIVNSTVDIGAVEMVTELDERFFIDGFEL